MSGKEKSSLAEQLAQKERQLALVTAIDHIRDTMPEPLVMLNAIVNLLAEEFAADLCVVSLLDRETGDVELKAVNDRSEPGEDLAQFAAHRTTAQDGQRTGQLLRGDRFPGGPVGDVGQAGDPRDDRP